MLVMNAISSVALMAQENLLWSDCSDISCVIIIDGKLPISVCGTVTGSSTSNSFYSFKYIPGSLIFTEHDFSLIKCDTSKWITIKINYEYMTPRKMHILYQCEAQILLETFLNQNFILNVKNFNRKKTDYYVDCVSLDGNIVRPSNYHHGFSEKKFRKVRKVLFPQYECVGKRCTKSYDY